MESDEDQEVVFMWLGYSPVLLLLEGAVLLEMDAVFASSHAKIQLLFVLAGLIVLHSCGA